MEGVKCCGSDRRLTITEAEEWRCIVGGRLDDPGRALDVFICFALGIDSSEG